MIDMTELIDGLVSDSVPEQQRAALLQVLYDELELRVGTRLANGLTDDQLAAFEVFVNQNDEAGALRWLQQNAPDYAEQVQDEFEAMRQELEASSDDLRALLALYLDVDIVPPRRANPWQSP
jgi:Mg2+ and Co2+ transporter CorA